MPRKAKAILYSAYLTLRRTLHRIRSNVSSSNTEHDSRLDEHRREIIKLKSEVLQLRKLLSRLQAHQTEPQSYGFAAAYETFEDKFRGTEATIKARLEDYKPFLSALPAAIKELSVIDIGCGRGEFLDIVHESGLNGIGIDSSRFMIERAKKRGHRVQKTDALAYLRKQKSDSLLAVTGFHVIEHLPFPALLDLFEQSYRVIAPGGLAIFETPNPANLSVGANTFYLDPTHQRPLPSELVVFALEQSGFTTEVLFLHSMKPAITSSDPHLTEIYNSLYGAADYAVIAKK